MVECCLPSWGSFMNRSRTKAVRSAADTAASSAAAQPRRASRLVQALLFAMLPTQAYDLVIQQRCLLCIRI